MHHREGQRILILRNFIHLNISDLKAMLLPGWKNSALKSTTCPLWSRILRLTDASSLGPDSSRTSPGNDTEKQAKRRKNVLSSLMEWVAITNGMPDMIKQFMTQYLKSAVICIHSSTRFSCVYHVISWIQSYRVTVLFLWLLPIEINRQRPNAADA